MITFLMQHRRCPYDLRSFVPTLPAPIFITVITHTGLVGVQSRPCTTQSHLRVLRFDGAEEARAVGAPGHGVRGSSRERTAPPQQGRFHTRGGRDNAQ